MSLTQGTMENRHEPLLGRFPWKIVPFLRKSVTADSCFRQREGGRLRAREDGTGQKTGLEFGLL